MIVLQGEPEERQVLPASLPVVATKRVAACAGRASPTLSASATVAAATSPGDDTPLGPPMRVIPSASSSCLLRAPSARLLPPRRSRVKRIVTALEQR